MAIDDEIENSAIAAEIRQEAEQSFQHILLKAGIAGKISLIPFGVGSAINETLTQLSFRRVHERMLALMDELTGRIKELGGEKIDRDFFRGEEFQTLMFEALRQLHVTHHKKKIEMLGKALANSGATEFKEETNKELFIQLVRDLTPLHIAMLQRLTPPKKMSPEFPDFIPWQQRPEITRGGSDLLILQMLAADGLIEEKLKGPNVREPSIGSLKSLDDARRTIRGVLKELRTTPLRSFRLSELGSDFLKFVGPEKEAEKPPTQ